MSDAQERLAAIRARVAFGQTHRTATPYSEPGAPSLQTQLADDGAWLLERLDAAEATISALRAFALDTMDCLERVADQGRPLSLDQLSEVKLAVGSLRRALSPAADPGSGGGDDRHTHEEPTGDD